MVGGIGDNSGYQAIVDQLNDSTAFQITATLVAPTDVDSVAKLGAYNTVVIGDPGYNESSYSTYSQALNTWVQSGGGVVATGWFVYANSSQQDANIDAVVPVNGVGSYSYDESTTITVNDTAHPVTNGISTIETQTFVEHPNGGIDPGATLLGSSPGGAAIVAGADGTGKTVYLGPIYSASTSYQNADLRSGAADQLLE